MQNRELFSFGNEWNYKSISVLIILAVLPNVLGLINLPTLWGFKIHLFQYAVFLAAAIYGPFGGLISGGVGSVFTSMMMKNPYIIIGNMALGFFCGLFLRKGAGMIKAVLFAYIIQMPWLWLTDVYLAGMSVNMVNGVVIALLVSDLFWAIVTKYSYKPIKRVIC